MVCSACSVGVAGCCLNASGVMDYRSSTIWQLLFPSHDIAKMK